MGEFVGSRAWVSGFYGLRIYPTWAKVLVVQLMHMCVSYVLLVYSWSTYGRKRVREKERRETERERESHG